MGIASMVGELPVCVSEFVPNLNAVRTDAAAPAVAEVLLNLFRQPTQSCNFMDAASSAKQFGSINFSPGFERQ